MGSVISFRETIHLSLDGRVKCFKKQKNKNKKNVSTLGQLCPMLKVYPGKKKKATADDGTKI